MSWGPSYVTTLREYSAGLLTTPEPDQLPLNALSYAKNIVLKSNGAAIAQRPGWRPESGTDAELGTLPYISSHVHRYESGESVAFLQDSFGRLIYTSIPEVGLGETIFSAIFNTVTTPFAAVSLRDTTFFLNGGTITGDGWTGTKWKGMSGGLPYMGSFQRFGIVRPGSGPTLTTPTSGSMTDTYDVALTYYNADTGAESSRSDSVSSGAISSKSLTVSWSAPSDTQVTHVRVYLRQRSLSGSFYRAASIAIGTTSTVLDIDSDEFNALTNVAPGVSTNDPPPSGARTLAVFKGRMIVATKTRLYWSRLHQYEAFNEEEFLEVAPQNGQEIIALHVDPLYREQLLILKEGSTYALVGESPADWSLVLVDATVGCVSHRTVASAAGRVWWMSSLGPIAMQGGVPTRLARGRIEELVSADRIATDLLHLSHTWVEPNDDRVVFFLPEVGKTTASIGLSYSLLLDTWESLWIGPRWTVLLNSRDAEEVPVTHAISAAFYRWHRLDPTVGADGVAPSTGVTHSGTLVAASETLSEITDAALLLSYRYQGLLVTLSDAAGVVLGTTEIAVHDTNGVVTFVTPLLGLTIGTLYTWQIGAIDSEAWTAWSDDGDPFTRKRFEYIYLMLRGGGSAGSCTLALHREFSPTATRTWALSASSGLSAWDSALWDAALWGGRGGAVYHRLRAATTGHTWQLRWRASTLFQSLEWLKGGLRGESLTDKR